MAVKTAGHAASRCAEASKPPDLGIADARLRQLSAKDLFGGCSMWMTRRTIHGVIRSRCGQDLSGAAGREMGREQSQFGRISLATTADVFAGVAPFGESWIGAILHV